MAAVAHVGEENQFKRPSVYRHMFSYQVVLGPEPNQTQPKKDEMIALKKTSGTVGYEVGGSPVYDPADCMGSVNPSTLTECLHSKPLTALSSPVLFPRNVLLLLQ